MSALKNLGNSGKETVLFCFARFFSRAVDGSVRNVSAKDVKLLWWLTVVRPHPS